MRCASTGHTIPDSRTHEIAQEQPMKMQKIALACLLACSSLPAMAINPDNQVTPVTVNANTREAFDAVAKSVRAEMVTGGRFEFVTDAERKSVEEALDRMAKIYENAPTVDALNKTDQVALFNQQETVNAILKNRDSDRLICKREKKIGSNLGQTSCITYGERERTRRDSQNELNRIQKGHATNNG
jgi:hypothetical protein